MGTPARASRIYMVEFPRYRGEIRHLASLEKSRWCLDHVSILWEALIPLGILDNPYGPGANSQGCRNEPSFIQAGKIMAPQYSSACLKLRRFPRVGMTAHSVLLSFHD